MADRFDPAPGARIAVRQALSLAAAILEDAGVEMPRLESRVLLGHVLGLQTAHLLLEADRPLTPAQWRLFRDLTGRRAASRLPLPYLTGRCEFYSLPLLLTPGILVPRPETEGLVACVLERLNGAADIADIGTGSGAIAVALAVAAPRCRVLATDIDPAAVDCARLNILLHGLSGRIEVVRADILPPPEALPTCPQTFDVICSNPPYIASHDLPALPPEVKNEPRRALDGGGAGLETIERLVPLAAERLRPGGLLALEIGVDQATAVVDIIGRGGNLSERVEVLVDSNGVERYILARRPGPTRGEQVV